MQNIFNEWYWNENFDKRKFILWELLKEVRSHSTDMINIDKQINPKRFQAIGNFTYLMTTFIPSMFVNRIEDDGTKTPIEHPHWHWFRSIQYIRLTDNGEKADIQRDFEKLTYGWDLIIDFDNKQFKKWINEQEKEGKLIEIIKNNIQLIFSKIVEGIIQPYGEVKIVKSYLDSLKVPYILNFTGSGFRIAIYWEDLKIYFSADDYGIMNKKLGEFIVKEAFKKEKAKTFDTSTLGFGMGVSHAMWSMHPITLLVRFPLSDEEFNNFNLNMAKPEIILERIGNDIKPSPKPYNLKRRGDLSLLYAQFKQNIDMDQHELKKQKQKIEKERIKEEIMEKMRGLSNQDREEVIMRVKND
ncbi:MAG: hypothetical protein AABX29_07725 [Nanoarchaeota archaeon]